jgi:hypothetical protein
VNKKLLSTGMKLAEIAWIIENLRGVVYLNKVNKEKLRTIARRFRYRNIGILPSMAVEEEKPFIKLVYPSKAVEKFKFNPAVEAIALASCYVSPIITFQQDYEDLRPFAIDEVYTNKELDEKDLKLHFRIADYSVIDFYKWAVDSFCLSMEKGKIREHLEERRKRVEKDKRRYWRISSKEGKTFIAYLDLAQFLVEELDKERLEELISTFGIVTAVIL